MGKTIAAIATAVGNAGVGIIRISGDEAFAVADRLTGGVAGRMDTHTVKHCVVRGTDGEILDDALLIKMAAPASYTGEDVLEIHCHGGAYVLRRVLAATIEAGAHPAEPGQFTKRAFLNGKLDLSQAEAVMDLIQSENAFALESSNRQLRGSTRNLVRGWCDTILYHTAFIETALDDPEHIDVTGYGETLLQVLRPLIEEMERAIAEGSDGRILKEGIHTVIVGRPNAGKSSLLNALLGEERAIVTEIPGTTRDALEESLSLGEVSLRIIDTAGIRDQGDVVEQIGIERARTYAQQADLILYVIDGSLPMDAQDEAIRALIRDKKKIILLNKADIAPIVDENDVRVALGESETPILSISAKEGDGLSLLKETIRKMFASGAIAQNDQGTITSIRHLHRIEEAKGSLEKVCDSIEAGLPEDFYSIDLMAAYESLGEITGETGSEDLINEIFGKFCVGK